MRKTNPAPQVELFNESKFSCEINRNFSCSTHINLEIEFVTVLQGTLKMEIENADYTLRENDGVFILPFESHSFECDDGAYRVYMCERNIVKTFSEFLKDKAPVKRHFTLSQALRAYLDSLYLGAGVQYTALQAEAMLSPIAAIIAEQCVFNQEKRIDSSLFSNALKIINERFLFEISLDAVAEEIGCHAVTLSKLFRAAAGIGFSEYITLRRCYYAKQLLERSNANIGDIALNAGFGSTRNFNRCFKKVFSLTPAEHRKSKEIF